MKLVARFIISPGFFEIIYKGNTLVKMFNCIEDEIFIIAFSI